MESNKMIKENNDKNVYIIGAGFSKELGLPLQDDFLMMAKEVFFRDQEKYKYFENIFRYQDNISKMRKFLNYPLLNLEHLFNLLEMDIFYSKNRSKTEIKSHFIKLIKDVLLELTPSPFELNKSSNPITKNKEYDNYLSFLQMLIKESKHEIVYHDDTIISFNYDLVVENSICAYNWRIIDQNKYNNRSSLLFLNTLFDKENIIIEEPGKQFTSKQLRSLSSYPYSDIHSSSDNSIKIIKLHGSINWNIGKENIPFIIPPTWNKSDTNIRKLWERAYQELTKAKRIIIIGYSFPETDIYVKSLLALALNENRIIQNIFFINPDTEQVKRNSLSLLDNYFEKYCAYKEWTFSELINSEEGKRFIESKLNRKLK